MSLRSSLVEPILARHDSVSYTRQRSIAQLVVAFSLLMALTVALLGVATRWSVAVISPPAFVFLLLFLPALTCLSYTARFFRGFNKELSVTNPLPHPVRSVVAYYVGGVCLLSSGVPLVAATGGVLESPLTGVHITLLLLSQQLGRYRPNAVATLTIAVVTIVAMFAWEWLLGASGEVAPASIRVTLLLAAFAAAAFITISEKGPNPLIDDGPPSELALYLTPRGWKGRVGRGGAPVPIPILDLSQEGIRSTCESIGRLWGDSRVLEVTPHTQSQWTRIYLLRYESAEEGDRQSGSKP